MEENLTSEMHKKYLFELRLAAVDTLQ